MMQLVIVGLVSVTPLFLIPFFAEIFTPRYPTWLALAWSWEDAPVLRSLLTVCTALYLCLMIATSLASNLLLTPTALVIYGYKMALWLNYLKSAPPNEES